MLKRILDNILKEPLAGIAIVVTITLAIFQSEWLHKLLESEVELNAYYRTLTDGRCSLIAFSIDNKTSGVVSDLRVFVVEDWMTKSGQDDLILFDRETGLIGAGEQTPIPYRDVLDVKYYAEGHTLHIPTLFPGEYLDLDTSIYRFSARLRSQGRAREGRPLVAVGCDACG